jgi:hypothetical protein
MRAQAYKKKRVYKKKSKRGRCDAEPVALGAKHKKYIHIRAQAY